LVWFRAVDSTGYPSVFCTRQSSRIVIVVALFSAFLCSTLQRASRVDDGKCSTDKWRTN